MAKTTTARKLTGGIIAIVVLSLCLCVTTYALVRSVLKVENNVFSTGEVAINLNDGEPIIEEDDDDEFIFEPGMTVVKPFFIKNDSSASVYYKVYLSQVSGGLADVLELTIKDGDTVLCSGKVSDLTRQNVTAAGTLAVGERRDLTAEFHFPEESGNSAQNLDLSFVLCADATQTRNNPNRLFE